ncbi:MAG: nondiscriminating glutamyl-tRNA synthetase [Planctomycetota bacterium]|jgi:nondiscriminating glutamyl-tRNA synthetase
MLPVSGSHPYPLCPLGRPATSASFTPNLRVRQATNSPLSDSIRVRIAPSPTGTIHLGLARTSLFNWAFARRKGGTFILRIEDTDAERSTAESEAAIIEGLSWLGIQWDEGPDVGGPYAPYRQSERSGGHLDRARNLLEGGHAYRCFCTRARLDELREGQQSRKETPRYDGHCKTVDTEESGRRADAGEPHTVRFNIPAGRTGFTDLVRGEVSFDNAEVDDWVMVRQDRRPTYNFVVVCDDADMHISHVLRGEEHLVNTPKQILLYRALDLEPPIFGHLPLMLGSDRKKLSKRTGDTSLGEYRAAGYPKEAIVNFLCLQGWALDGETEIFSNDQLLAAFEIGDVSKGGSIFDIDKFKWMSGEYIKVDDPQRLATRCLPFVVDAGLTDETSLQQRSDWFRDIVWGERERIRLYSELPARVAHYFADDATVEYQPKAEAGARKRDARVATLAAYREWLQDRASDEEPEALAAASKEFVSERGLKIPELFQPLRCALTGQPGGRDLFELMSLLGRDSSIARIEAGILRLA